MRNITQAGTDALDVLLVGPGGQTAIIFSDVGFNSSANNLTVTLDDQAATQMPSAGPIPNGAFQPTNFQSGGHLFLTAGPGGHAAERLGAGGLQRHQSERHLAAVLAER